MAPSCTVVLAIGIVLAAFLTPGMPKETEPTTVCGRWAGLAEQMTGSGKYQTCVNNKTTSCTRVDCTGTVTYTHPRFSGAQHNAIEVDYCFGSVLNSCLKPISIDAYLEVPDKKQKWSGRIRQDTDIKLKGISYPLGQMGQVYPMLYFEFEQQPKGTIKYSVKVKLMIASSTEGKEDMYLPGLDRTLIDEEIMPEATCSELKDDTSNKPSAHLIMDQCHADKYSPLSPRSGSLKYKPSETLGKSCNPMRGCDPTEICDMALPKPLCVCKKENKLSPKKDGCISTGRIGETCRQVDDCGYFEECVSSSGTCQCVKGFAYSHVYQMCVHQPGTPTEAPPGGKDKPGPDADSTQAPGPGVNGTSAHTGGSSFVHDKLPLILGCAIGGVVALALSVWAVIYLSRRARGRRRLDAALSMHDESTDALLGDTDDMIM